MKRPLSALSSAPSMRPVIGLATTIIVSLGTLHASTSALHAQESKSSVLSELKLPRIGSRKSATARELEKATFKLVEGDGRIYFSLMVGEDVLLRSPGYATERAINEAMDEVKSRIKRLRAMPLRRLETGEHYFVVTTSRDDVLATSPLYASAEEARTMRMRVKGVLIEAK